ALADARVRLLAFVATTAAAAVGLISGRPPAVELLAIGVLGLSATLGILVYELHNSQVASDLARQADRLERALAFGGSVLAERAGETRRLFGVVRLSRGRALALVYA